MPYGTKFYDLMPLFEFDDVLTRKLQKMNRLRTDEEKLAFLDNMIDNELNIYVRSPDGTVIDPEPSLRLMWVFYDELKARLGGK